MFHISVLIIGLITNCALSNGTNQRPDIGHKILAFCVQVLVESVAGC